MIEDSDQHRDKRQKMETDTRGDEDKMEVARSIKPMNHDRNAEVKEEDEMPPQLQVESDEISLDQLQKDMGDAFLLGRSSKALHVILLTCILTCICRAATSRSKSQFSSPRCIWSGTAA